MTIAVLLVIVSALITAWTYLKTFKEGMAYGRHIEYQRKMGEAPTVPITNPKPVKKNPIIPVERIVNPPSEQFIGPYSEPQISESLGSGTDLEPEQR